jgi:hypothetical protein
MARANYPASLQQHRRVLVPAQAPLYKKHIPAYYFSEMPQNSAIVHADFVQSVSYPDYKSCFIIPISGNDAETS